VNGSMQSPARLIVPPIERVSYAKLYHILQTGDDSRQTTKLINASNSQGKTALKAHRVREGENLEEIAQHYNVTIQDLKVWNHLKNTTILPGQKLKVSNGIDENIVPEKASQYITYKVKKGDTLIGITKLFKGTSVSSIKAMNELESSILKPGMTLRINQL